MSELCANPQCRHAKSAHLPDCWEEMCDCKSYVPPATPSAAPPQTAQIACFGKCGKMLTVPVPFIGDVLCGDCGRGQTASQGTTAAPVAPSLEESNPHTPVPPQCSATMTDRCRKLDGHDGVHLGMFSQGWKDLEAKLPAPDAQGGDESDMGFWKWWYGGGRDEVNHATIPERYKHVWQASRQTREDGIVSAYRSGVKNAAAIVINTHHSDTHNHIRKELEQSDAEILKLLLPPPQEGGN